MYTYEICMQKQLVKKAMNLKESGEGHMGGFRGRKEKCNYNVKT